MKPENIVWKVAATIPYLNKSQIKFLFVYNNRHII